MLGWLRAPQATLGLVAASRDENPEVRRAAVAALAFAGDAAQAALVAAVTDPDWQVRESAVSVLSKLASPKAFKL